MWMFLKRMKYRIFVISALAATFNSWANATIFASSGLERAFKRWKHGHIYKNYPQCMGYDTAFETNWESGQLSRESSERLGQIFVMADREIKGGVTRPVLEQILGEMDRKPKSPKAGTDSLSFKDYVQELEL